MAQLVARLNGIQKARGSNPLVSTKNLAILCNGVARFFSTRGFERAKSQTVL